MRSLLLLRRHLLLLLLAVVVAVVSAQQQLIENDDDELIANALEQGQRLPVNNINNNNLLLPDLSSSPNLITGQPQPQDRLVQP